MLSLSAGQQRRAAPSQPHHHEGKQLAHLQPLPTQTTILFFTFSTEFRKLHERFNTYKIGFVLDDFVQLWANVSVLSMFKVG